MAADLVEKEWGRGAPEPLESKESSAFSERDSIQKTPPSPDESRNSVDFGPGRDLWINPELNQHDDTVNLDHQLPATLYYLGLVVDIPKVICVYVEELERGRRKHWTVLSERDYGVMDHIYDIEEDTLDKFPAADLDFRVTVHSDGGPSVSSHATKIYDTE